MGARGRGSCTDSAPTSAASPDLRKEASWFCRLRGSARRNFVKARETKQYRFPASSLLPFHRKLLALGVAPAFPARRNEVGIRLGTDDNITSFPYPTVKQSTNTKPRYDHRFKRKR